MLGNGLLNKLCPGLPIDWNLGSAPSPVKLAWTSDKDFWTLGATKSNLEGTPSLKFGWIGLPDDSTLIPKAPASAGLEKFWATWFKSPLRIPKPTPAIERVSSFP